jgi:predicted hydrocarbon binding protein
MSHARVPIEIDPETGVWTTDGMPMLYVPRHFFLNNHLAVEQALGQDRYARLLYDAGRESAYVWCEKEAQTHGLSGVQVFHHYMLRLSQRGWGRFTPIELEPAHGAARVKVEHSAFVYHLGGDAGRKVCYMFAGWFPGALAWVARDQGWVLDLQCREVQCAAEAGSGHCVFEVSPVS